MNKNLQLPDELRERSERNYFEHYIFYTSVKKNYREGVCSACGERIYVRHCPDGYPDGILFYGDSDLWYARHGTKGECPHCGVKVTYKASGIAKGCYNLEETTNLVFFVSEENGNKVYAYGYTVLAQPHTSGRTRFHWYPKAKYIFEPGKCYAEIYPYMLYNYFGRYGELMRTCGWREVGSVRFSGDKPYEPWQGYMYSPANYWLVNMKALDDTFLRYADLDGFLRIGHRNQASHLYAMKYLWWYCHYPTLEIAMRTGVHDVIQNAVYDGIKSHADVDLAARRPWDFYRLPKLDYNLWISTKDFYLLKIIHKRKITGQKPMERLLEAYALCRRRAGDVGLVLGVLDELSLDLKQWLKYMRHKKHKSDISNWLDYVSMASRKNMLGKINPFPKDINQAHDAFLEHLNAESVKRKIEGKKAYINSICKKFPGVKKTLEKIRKKYEYANEVYQIVVPKGVKDIVAEGVKLNHCVDKSDRYFERIVSHESYIFFLRRAENPDLPWYTLEVEPDGTIRQKRSFWDKQHEDLEAARPFLKEWQTVVAGRLEEEDLAAAGVSREKRIENYKDLRDSKKRIYDGRLLADVLEADLEENLEVRIA